MKKRRSSIKGLVLVVIILGAIGVYFFLKYTKDNMTFAITTYYGQTIAPNSWVVYKNQKVKSDDKGEAKFNLRVSKNDKVILKAENSELGVKVLDTILISEERYLAGYTSVDLQLNRK